MELPTINAEAAGAHATDNGTDASAGDPADADRHYIEECATVHLRLTADGWSIDGHTVDGYSLHGYDSGPLSGNCACNDQDECDQLVAEAEKLPIPTAEQLLHLLADALDYAVTKAGSERAGVATELLGVTTSPSEDEPHSPATDGTESLPIPHNNELHGALVRLCQGHGTTTPDTYRLLRQAVASITGPNGDTDEDDVWARACAVEQGRAPSDSVIVKLTGTAARV